MPDITMCKMYTCPKANECYRFTATPTPGMQSYFLTREPCPPRSRCGGVGGGGKRLQRELRDQTRREMTPIFYAKAASLREGGK